MLEKIWDAVTTFRVRGENEMTVKVQPDNDTEMQLTIKYGNGGVEIEARMQQGDGRQLASGWNELQQQLSERGVNLGDLASEDSEDSEETTRDSDPRQFNRQGQPQSQPTEFQIGDEEADWAAWAWPLPAKRKPPAPPRLNPPIKWRKPTTAGKAGRKQENLNHDQCSRHSIANDLTARQSRAVTGQDHGANRVPEPARHPDAQPDPLKPVSDTEFIAQMAQFTSLEQTKEMSTDLQQLRQSYNLTQGTALMGKPVKVATGEKENQVFTNGIVTDLKVNKDGDVSVILNGQTYDLDSVIEVHSETPQQP